MEESAGTSIPIVTPGAGMEQSAGTSVPASVPTVTPGAGTEQSAGTSVPTGTPGAETASAGTSIPASVSTAPPDDTGLEPESTDTPEEISGENANAPIDAGGSYTTAEDVALYLHTYGELPDNFITKKEANALGWSGGSLESYAPGKCIGGDKFGNYEGVLPDGNYHECDIDTLGAKKRGAKRLVYSDDGRIYYTEDHYETFTLLYGEE